MYNRNRRSLYTYRAPLPNIEKPLFVLYNKKEAFIKSIFFFSIGCALLSIIREQLPLAIVKNAELKNIILFFVTFVSGCYLIFRGLRYDNIYCILINKRDSTYLKSNGEMLSATLLLFSFFFVFWTFFWTNIFLNFGSFFHDWD